MSLIETTGKQYNIIPLKYKQKVNEKGALSNKQIVIFNNIYDS